MLVNPARNLVRGQPYEAQIEYHHLPVGKRQYYYNPLIRLLIETITSFELQQAKDSHETNARLGCQMRTVHRPGVVHIIF